MKSDAELKRDIEAELAWDPAVRAASIGVAVQDGVVTVTGHLQTFAERHAVERVLRRVGGVKAIAIEIDVRLAPSHRRSDTEIATAIEQALRWNTVVPVAQVQVTVDNGWVTLRGDVEWDYQRRSVEKAIRPLMGVVGISNEMTIRTRVAPADLQLRIAGALKRQAEREARRLDIRVEGGCVTLRGNVHSWYERDAAQGAAWSAPGVRMVVNEINID
jgi:osmotically-inducible protein OsmY